MLQAMEGEGVEKLKSRKQTARAAHRRLRIAQSDALNALSAFVSWLGAQNKELFCRCAELRVLLACNLVWERIHMSVRP